MLGLALESLPPVYSPNPSSTFGASVVGTAECCDLGPEPVAPEVIAERWPETSAQQ
jgi:hypothetical protein